MFTFSDPTSWFVESVEEESQQILRSFDPITVPMNNPTLRFYHEYDTEAGADGGFVEISVDGGTTWKRLEDEFFRNEQPTDISYQTIPIPFLAGFSGQSNGFIPSYADLSNFAGQDILLRFQFVTDAAAIGGLGWFVDDIEMMELLSHNTDACVTTEQGDAVCATAASRGTIVNSAEVTSTNDPIPGTELNVFPNPVSDVLTLNVVSDRNEEMNVRMLTIDGKEVFAQQLRVNGITTATLPVDHLASGFYFVELRSGSAVLTEKVIVD